MTTDSKVSFKIEIAEVDGCWAVIITERSTYPAIDDKKFTSTDKMRALRYAAALIGQITGKGCFTMTYHGPSSVIFEAKDGIKWYKLEN